MTDAPELPETLSEATDIDNAYELELPDGTVYEMPGVQVLAVYAKYDRDAWGEWVEAVQAKFQEWSESGRYPADKFGGYASIDEDETLADIAEEALYFGDLRAAQMQIALATVASEEDEEPVRVVGIAEGGERTYDVEEGLGGADVEE